MKKYSLNRLFNQFKFRIIATVTIVLLEVIVTLLFPLFIGYAINDLLDHKLDGLYVLVALTIISIVVGATRRFIDSRVYAKIFRTIALELVEDEEKKGSNTSVVSARIHLLMELVEFFENSFPQIISSFVGIIGILIIIYTINTIILLLCVGAMFGIILVYGLSSKKNWQLNSSYNDQTELLVSTLERKDNSNTETYLKKFMTTNIKLSDFEMMNFSVVSFISMSVFLLSIFVIVREGGMTYGLIFSTLMYIFDFVEKSVILPLYYQNYVRLLEISTRLS